MKKQSKFWAVMRLSAFAENKRNGYIKFNSRDEALKVSQEAARKNPNVSGFVVMEAVTLVAPSTTAIASEFNP